VRVKEFRFEGPDVREDIRAKYAYDGSLLDLYCTLETGMANKWHHYLPLYERYFARFRGRPLRFLEIGVARGGSLELWRGYFGPEATIFGIDIDPLCAGFDGLHGQVRIGSQDDAAFLGRVVEEMGGVDVVLDDGSHRMPHVRASLAALFPRLESGGIYMIEDLHTAYWPGFGGGLRRKRNFFHDVRLLVDDMHRWYHEGDAFADWSAALSGIHVHDSIVVLEKGEVHRPVHSTMGSQKAARRRRAKGVAA
jgi:hypothetical protein